MERTARESVLAHYRAINEGLSSRETQEGDYDLNYYDLNCMFMNNFFYNIYIDEDDNSISRKGSNNTDWLCLISIIYSVISCIDHSPLEIILEIILLCLVIRSLQFTDMFGNRLDTRLKKIETRMEEGLTRMEEGFEEIIETMQTMQQQMKTMQTMQQQMQTMQQQMQTMQQQMQTMQQQIATAP